MVLVDSSTPLTRQYRSSGIRAACRTLLGGLIVAALAIAAAPDVHAQQQQQLDEGATQTQTPERTRKKLEEIRREERLRKGPGFELPVIETEGEGVRIPKRGEGPKFLARRIDIPESEILSAEEIGAIVSRYEGREVELADLYELVAEINALYREKGFVTARALLPPQTISEGVVIIELIEGIVGRIRIEGNAYTRPEFIAGRLDLEEGDLVNLEILERALIRFNKLNSVRLGVRLEPGEEFATTDIVVLAEEPQLFTFTPYFDSDGTVATGEYRTGGLVGIAAASGSADPVSLGFTRINGLHSGFLSYAVSLTTWGTRLSSTVSVSKSEIKRGPFGGLGITSSSRQFGVRLSQPLFINRYFLVSVDAGLDESDSTSDLAGLEQKTGIGKGSGGLVVEGAGDTAFWTVAVRGNRFYAEVETAGVEARTYHTTLATEAAYYQRLGETFAFFFRGRGQYAHGEPLPPAEQFYNGGATSLRAYELFEFAGDDGYNAVVELQANIPLAELRMASQDVDPTLQLYVFYDHGGAFPFRAKGTKQIQRIDFANAAGAGFRVFDLLGGGSVDAFYARSLDGRHRGVERDPRV